MNPYDYYITLIGCHLTNQFNRTSSLHQQNLSASLSTQTKRVSRPSVLRKAIPSLYGVQISLFRSVMEVASVAPVLLGGSQL